MENFEIISKIYSILENILFLKIDVKKEEERASGLPPVKLPLERHLPGRAPGESSSVPVGECQVQVVPLTISIVVTKYKL